MHIFTALIIYGWICVKKEKGGMEENVLKNAGEVAASWMDPNTCCSWNIERKVNNQAIENACPNYVLTNHILTKISRRCDSYFYNWSFIFFLLVLQIANNIPKMKEQHAGEIRSVYRVLSNCNLFLRVDRIFIAFRNCEHFVKTASFGCSKYIALRS